MPCYSGFMKKLFLGLAIPDQLAKDFDNLKTGVSGASWGTAENAHITLTFIGEVDDHIADKLETLLSSIDIERFILTLQGPELFYKKEEPYILWVKVRHSDPLIALKKQIDALLKKNGISFEDRSYAPHMTLAFLNKPHMDDVNSFLETHKNIPEQNLTVNDFVLYQSAGSRAEPLYKKLKPYSLKTKET